MTSLSQKMCGSGSFPGTQSNRSASSLPVATSLLVLDGQRHLADPLHPGGPEVVGGLDVAERAGPLPPQGTRSPTGTSTATVSPGGASGQAHSGS